MSFRRQRFRLIGVAMTLLEDIGQRAMRQPTPPGSRRAR